MIETGTTAVVIGKFSDLDSANRAYHRQAVVAIHAPTPTHLPGRSLSQQRTVKGSNTGSSTYTEGKKKYSESTWKILGKPYENSQKVLRKSDSANGAYIYIYICTHGKGECGVPNRCRTTSAFGFAAVRKRSCQTSTRIPTNNASLQQ